MKAATMDHTYILCPTCGIGESRLDHLSIGRQFGPWYCDLCGWGYEGVRTQSGANVTPTLERSIKRLVKLQYVHDPRLTLMVEGLEHVGRDRLRDSHKSLEMKHAYYFNEHTCPSNFLGVDVIFEDDDDPHGIFKFVETLPEDES